MLDYKVYRIHHSPWTAADRVLMNFLNFSIIDGIYGRSSLASLIAFSATCHKARVSWREYTTRVFNVNRLLSQRFTDPNAFRDLQKATGAVIIGEVALLYFNRSPVDRAVFDIAINAEHAGTLTKLLILAEGFEVWDGNRWSDEAVWKSNDVRASKQYQSTRSIDTVGNRIDNSQDMVIRPSHHVPDTPFAKLLVFRRKARNHPGYVRVWIPKTATPDLILHSSTSKHDLNPYAVVLIVTN